MEDLLYASVVTANQNTHGEFILSNFLLSTIIGASAGLLEQDWEEQWPLFWRGQGKIPEHAAQLFIGPHDSGGVL